MRKLFSLVMAMAVSMFITACGGGISQEEVASQVASAKKVASTEAMNLEASRADAKLSAAKAEIKKLAIDTARQGGFSSSANCNVLPQGLAATSAAKNFPTNSPLEYKAICAQEVAVMNAERSAMKGKAIAQSKKAEQQRVASVAKSHKLQSPPKKS